MNAKRVTVLYNLIEETSWLGGANYFSNLKKIIEKYCPTIRMQAVSFGKLPAKYTVADSLKVRIMQLSGKPIPDRLILKGRQNYLKNLTAGNDICAYLLFAGHFNSVEGIPRMFWIPDFQVFHLPTFFTEADAIERKQNYKIGAEKAELIVLSSEDARNDFNKFYPGYDQKVKVLRFVVDMPVSIFSKDPSSVLEKYKLPEKFIYVPNQFWLHKNHGLILDALHELTKQNYDCTIVCSGSTVDPRNPDYFEQLKGKIEQYGLRERFIILGIIEKDDVAQLIRQSSFVINASRFEGWSTTVEEVKSIGKRIILSDIPVHREQDPPQATYFNADDTKQLSELMAQYWNSSQAGPDVAMEEAARAKMDQRLELFAQTFQDIVSSAIQLHKQ